MKRIAGIIFLFAISGYSFAQIWQDDFSNSGDWISADLNSGIDSWVISSAGIGGPVDSISSISAGNGFAQFNSEGQCSGNHQDVTLTYFQQINISAFNLSYLEFVQHYKRGSDTVYAEFSADGLVWESVRINEDYWYYQQTGNPDTVRISIPSSLQGAPFWLRFRYSGDCGYAWLLDDLKIYEKEQFALCANGDITMNGLGYVEIAHCFSDTLQGDLELLNFGYDTLFDVVIQTHIYLNGVIDLIRYDTLDQIDPEEKLSFTQIDLITDPFYYFENFVLKYSVYNASADTIRFIDSVLITYNNTKRYSDSIKGYFLTDNETWGIGNTFICTEYVCPIWTRVFVPNNPINLDQLIWLAFYKKVAGVWEFVTSSSDYTIGISDLGQWTMLNTYSDYPYYEPGDTGLVVFATYGSVFSMPYGDEDGGGSYLYDENMGFIFDPSGHPTLIELNPYGGFECSTCWEALDENGLPKFSISPNPSSFEIQLNNFTQSIKGIKIYSLDGRQVYADLEPKSTIIPISFLANGTYLILVETDDGIIMSGRFEKI